MNAMIFCIYLKSPYCSGMRAPVLITELSIPIATPASDDTYNIITCFFFEAII